MHEAIWSKVADSYIRVLLSGLRVLLKAHVAFFWFLNVKVNLYHFKGLF